MNNIRILIVDDEAPARTLVRKYLESVEGVEVVGECANGFEVLKEAGNLKPDLILLDIQMPKITGFELLEVLDPCPEIIFITAYDQFAIKAFEMNAIDYLLKPFPKERLLKAIDKARDRMGLMKDGDSDESTKKLKKTLEQEEKELERVITKMGSKITVIPVNKICYIEAQDDYVMIYTADGNHLKDRTMKYFEAHLPKGQFVRIHRSHIINIADVTGVELYGKETHLISLKCGAQLRASQEGYRRLKGML